MTYDHKLHVAQEQYDSREPRDDSQERCDNCAEAAEAHTVVIWAKKSYLLCAEAIEAIQEIINDSEFEAMTEGSERELRAAMRGDL